MKKLSLLFVLCMFSVLAFAQIDSSNNLADQPGPVEDAPSNSAVINPASWPLGNVPVEFAFYQDFIVTNGSEDNFTITGIDPPVVPFVIANTNCQGNLQPGASCAVTVRLYATALGPLSTTLKVHSSAGSVQAVMTARVITGDVTLNPVSCIDVPQEYFPCYASLFNPRNRTTLTLTNNQNTGLTIDSISPEPNTFVLTADGTCPQNPLGGTVPPHSSCTIGVKYTGGTYDPVTGTLSINTNSLDQTPYWVNLCHKPYCG